MKKTITFVLIVLLAVGLLAGCGGKGADSSKIVIGVSPDPHSKLVEFVVDELKEEGIEIEIKEFTDYVLPNTALDDGDLDANFFQHLPYLEDFIEKQGVKLASIGGVHVEPMALYSEEVTSIDQLEDGAEIAIPNDAVNGGRALILLQENGLIKLAENAGLSATEKDIIENPKNLKITALEAALLPKVLDDVTAAIINGNYALEAGFNPVKDGIIVEDANSPYVNILVVREGEEDQDKYKKLLEALNSAEMKRFIEETYDGAIVPAF